MRGRISRFIARWEIHWAVITVVLYTIAIVLVAFVFPDVSNLWVSIFVLFGGLTTSLNVLATLLKTKAEHE